MTRTAQKIQDVEVLPPETGTNIIEVIEARPQIALLDAVKYDAFYQRIKAETEKLVPNTETAKGRDEIRSMAAKVTKAKAGIDKARLALTSEWREQTRSVNEAGKKIEADLSQLAEDVRKPLTEWETAEKKRTDRANELIAAFKADAIITIDDTSQSVRDRGRHVWGVSLDGLGDKTAEAEAAKSAAVDALKAALARLIREEADKAELDRLRSEAIEREARELAEIESREAKERAEREAKEAEEQRAAAEKAEADRIEQMRKDAAEAAQREAEDKAKAEREATERAHAEELASERKAREDAEREMQMEREAILQAEKQRKAMADQLAAEQAQREADQAHRTKIKSEAKAAIMSCGADEETARKIVMAIIAKEVPHVRLEF